MSRKLDTLEMLRALAALAVVMFHTQFSFAPRTGVIPFRVCLVAAAEASTSFLS